MLSLIFNRDCKIKVRNKWEVRQYLSSTVLINKSILFFEIPDFIFLFLNKAKVDLNTVLATQETNVVTAFVWVAHIFLKIKIIIVKQGNLPESENKETN